MNPSRNEIVASDTGTIQISFNEAAMNPSRKGTTVITLAGTNGQLQ